MPYSKIIPTFQVKSWNRVGIPPAITIVRVIFEQQFSLINYITFTINYENTAVEWLSAPYNEYGYINAENGELQLFFQNTNDLVNGTYRANINVTAVYEDLSKITLSTYVDLVLSGTAPTTIATDKAAYNLVFNRATNELTGETAVGIVNNTDSVLLKFWQNGNIFDAAENFTDGFNLAENPAIPMATNPDLPETGSVSVPAKILKQTGEFVSGFTVNLIIVDGGIAVSPENLSFEVFKGSAEKSDTLTVTNPLGIDFEITSFPAWLSLDATSGNTSQNITVSTNTAALSVGDYSGMIRFEFNSDFIEIPVALSLKSFIVIDETKDFCLDLPDVKVNRKTEDAKFVRITMMAVYNVLGIVSTFEKVYQMPYFQGVASFSMGEKLHRHFPRAKRHFFDETELVFMQNIVASIKVEELNAALEVLFTETASDIKLFPGKKPLAYPLLSNAIHRKKNEKAIIFTSVVDGENIEIGKTEEADLPNPLILDSAEINFYDLPKVFSPVHLQWENQNLCPEWFTFTGDYKISPEFNHIYARNIFNAQNEKYDVSKVKTLTIDTGIFIAKERLLMSEIIESKISFIKIEGIIYRCFNITKKNVEVDSTEELISRSLEYLIVEQ